ncbi:hypothetical protein CTAYLR_006749 [Chrysophaeum taylorii]|uniref:HSF-type DNA-binding domain-containing protein n=1 Tax=Chrysophaeum taylorii TaxID=2483200 RepID=A0AAD7XJK0_9STRA|nr:hypothetical protein CTAYLR_006749 [Chrysophaeum taylorii]
MVPAGDRTLEMPSYKKRRYKPRERKTVPFLQKLISLFEDHPDLIKFDKGTIVIPNPKRLELVLPAYFRHGKYTSFQRQLNNFGYTKFDKSAGPLQSVYVKAKGPPVSCFQDLLMLRHSFRRVPADDDDDDDDDQQQPAAQRPRTTGAYHVSPRKPRQPAFYPNAAPLPAPMPAVAPPPDQPQFPASTSCSGGPPLFAAAAAAAAFPGPRAVAWDAPVAPPPHPRVPPAAPRPPVVAPPPKHQQQLAAAAAAAAAASSPPAAAASKPPQETSALEAVDNLLNLKHVRLSQQQQQQQQKRALEQQQPPPEQLGNAVDDARSIIPLPERPRKAMRPETWQQQQQQHHHHHHEETPPQPLPQDGYDAATVIDRANLTIDLLRSKLAAAERDRRAARDDATRLRYELAAFAEHKDEPIRPYFPHLARPGDRLVEQLG